jgi:hypothetical protein
MAEKKRFEHGEAYDAIKRSYVDCMVKLLRRPRRADIYKHFPDIEMVGKRTFDRHFVDLRRATFEELGVPDFMDKVAKAKNTPEKPKNWAPEPEKWLNQYISRLTAIKERFATSEHADDMTAWTAIFNLQRTLERQILKVQVGILDKDQVVLLSWDLVDHWVKDKAKLSKRRDRGVQKGHFDARERIEQGLWEIECQFTRNEGTYDPKVIYALCGFVRAGLNEIRDLQVLGGKISEGSLEYSNKYYKTMIKNLNINQFLKTQFKEMKRAGKI